MSLPEIIRQHLSQPPKVKAQANLEVLKSLINGQPLSPQQLAKFVGWGTIAPTLSGNQHRDLYLQFKKLLPRQDMNTDNAFCTNPDVIEAVWEGLQNMGFNAGRILEPASNIGYWKVFQPENLLKQSEWVMVEIDPFACEVAKQIHPDALAIYGSHKSHRIGFEHVSLPLGRFDLVISNFPFGATAPYDADFPNAKSLHEYFFEKSIAAIRPGGLVVAITSTFLLDKQTSDFREWLASQVNLLAAIRLPSNTFSQLGTSVTSDILVLHKPLKEKDLEEDPNWVFTSSTRGCSLNDYYFRHHSENLLGDLEPSKLYGRDHLGLAPREGLDLKSAIVDAFKRIRFTYKPQKVSTPLRMGLLPPELQGTVPGSFLWWQDKLYQYQGDGDQYGGLSLVTKNNDRIAAAMKLSDVYEALLKAERSDDPSMEDLRADLNRVYDAFQKKHGYLSTTFNKSLLREDPKLCLLAAQLEEVVEEDVA